MIGLVVEVTLVASAMITAFQMIGSVITIVMFGLVVEVTHVASAMLPALQMIGSVITIVMFGLVSDIMMNVLNIMIHLCVICMTTVIGMGITVLTKMKDLPIVC
jgi:hypothetical protein